ncbi:hypothetical protein CQ018_17820 [Arthrobacter sp. MYb227]|nr:hypothetical protein CQ018_17820 [Arthrobacter sp. MYb227]
MNMLSCSGKPRKYVQGHKLFDMMRSTYRIMRLTWRGETGGVHMLKFKMLTGNLASSRLACGVASWHAAMAWQSNLPIAAVQMPGHARLSDI